MTTWDDIENGSVDSFNRNAAPTRNAWDNKPVNDFNDLFSMVLRTAIPLAPKQFALVCTAERLKDNIDHDICKPVSVLEGVFNYKRDTLVQLLTKDSAYTARRKTDENGNPVARGKGLDGPLLTDFVWLRTKTVTSGNGDRYDDLQVDEERAHVWYSQKDSEPRWRLDLTPVNIVDGVDAKGRAKRKIATPADAFVRIPYWWRYEHPDTTGGDTWVEKRYYALVPEVAKDPVTGKRGKTGRMVKQDVTDKAVRAAAVVAACATHEFKRGQSYGIAGMATIAGISTTEMARDLGYAEDAELIGVANRMGRNKALRWVRLHPDDARSPEARVKRSHGPTKEHNADVMVERQATRDEQAALDAQNAVTEAEFEEATADWLRGLPQRSEMAYAAGDDEPPY